MWFGIADIHNQNILSGDNLATGEFVIAPIDIECALEPLQSPSDALLTPGLVPSSHCGLFSLRNCSARLTQNHKTAISIGYSNTIDTLNTYAPLVSDAFLEEIDLNRARLRVVVRNTKEYSLLAHDSTCISLYSCEEEQVSRGDIPYYYRYINGDLILYHDGKHEKVASFSNQMKIRTPVGLFNVDMNPLSNSLRRKNISPEGVNQIIDFFVDRL